MAPPTSVRQSDGMGYWGPPTSTLDWCETNYEVSFYIAEFWNTITNLGMIIPSIYGMLHCRKLRIETRYTCSFFMLLLVGIGSWMFHMTMKFEMQLLDEIPMLWCGSYMVYCLYTSRYSCWTDGARVAGIVIASNCLAATILYMLNKNPIFFQSMFSIMVISGVLTSIHINYKQYSVLGTKLSFSAVVFTFVGFLIWNIDNMYCAQVTQIREKIFRENDVLKYFSPLTQLHGWWHFFAALATYTQILASIQHRLLFLNMKHSLETHWTGVFIKVNAVHANGTFKSEEHKK